jgi:hypothetical protein
MLTIVPLTRAMKFSAAARLSRRGTTTFKS